MRQSLEMYLAYIRKLTRGNRWLVVLFVMVAVALAWYSLYSSGHQALNRIRSEGVLKVGYILEPPYIYNGVGGKLTGMQYEITQALAAGMGIQKVVWVPSDSATLFSDLQAGKFDAIASGLLIDSLSGRQVDFSEPVFHVSQALLVKRGNPLNLHSYMDVEKNGQARVAVLRGAAEDQLFKELGIPASRLIGVPDAGTGLSMVEMGAADALALPKSTVRMLLMRQALGGTELAEPIEQTPQPDGNLGGYAGTAFRKSDGALRDAWNEQIARFVGSPQYIFIIKKYGFNEADLPGKVTTRQILAAGGG